MKKTKYRRIQIVLIIFYLIAVNSLFAQTKINAEFELLAEYKNNSTEQLFLFYTNDYESYSPLGPLVDNKGNLLFFDFRDGKTVFDGKSFKRIQAETENAYIDSIAFMNTVSSNGIAINQAMQIYTFKNNDCQPHTIFGDDKFTSRYILFDEAALFIEKKLQDSFLVSFENGKTERIDYAGLPLWLEKHGYKLQENKIIYNQQVYASFDEEWFENNYLYGRLKNNYVIRLVGDTDAPSSFVITPFSGEDKVTLELNYSLSKNCNHPIVSWGIGNYGEIYILQGADLKTASNYYEPGYDNVKLFVIRNHLKFFGYLNDDRIRLRKGPGTNTESLGTYPINTGFRILEKSGVKQTIGGVTDEWIKVRLPDGTEGYFFGQYIQNLYDGPGTPLPWANVVSK